MAKATGSRQPRRPNGEAVTDSVKWAFACGDAHFTESVYDQKTAKASLRLKTPSLDRHRTWQHSEIKRQENNHGAAGKAYSKGAFAWTIGVSPFAPHVRPA